MTARAGSGKTRVIVAKVAYLVAQRQIPHEQISVFMFNRTAASEVNQRIKAVQIDGRPLVDPAETVKVASTFHKYALDIVKAVGERPQIISEADDQRLVQNALDSALQDLNHKTSPSEKRELLQIVSNFVTRAGQKFPGYSGLKDLECAVQSSCKELEDSKLQFYYRLSARVYARYLAQIQSPMTNFNLLMAHATELLRKAGSVGWTERICRLRYLMIDEYQDFSYLFFALIVAIRGLAPQAKLFAVGDDWQAINRFAGSDVDYFLQFHKFFPEDSTNIPLSTNYRSARRIVEHANIYMLTNYDAKALPARAFSQARGKIKTLNPTKTRFDATDVQEDALNDGRFQHALAGALRNQANISSHILSASQISPAAAKLLKTLYRIIKHHRHDEIMLLHRHNFSSFPDITLEILILALREILITERIMTEQDFARQVRYLTMHRSKGLESEVVILLEVDRAIVAACHPHATLFPLFGDTREAESADQKRLLYVAMTRAKKYLYILSQDKQPVLSFKGRNARKSLPK